MINKDLFNISKNMEIFELNTKIKEDPNKLDEIVENIERELKEIPLIGKIF